MNVLSRTIAIAVSTAIHVGGAGLALLGTGHPRAGTSDLAIVEIDIAPAEPPPARPADPEPTAAGIVAHTHPYPVSPSHDARPHDPSLRHPYAAVVATAPASTPEAPSVASAEPSLPRFTMTGGSRAEALPGAAAAGATAPEVPAGPASSSPMSASEVSVQARLVASVPSVYPQAARSDDVEGDVSLEIVLDTDGTVIDARALRRAGHGFDESAVAAVRRYRFTPAQRHGQAVRVRMPWTVQFRLR